jgi:hypothetical protein
MFFVHFVCLFANSHFCVPGASVVVAPSRRSKTAQMSKPSVIVNDRNDDVVFSSNMLRALQGCFEGVRQQRLGVRAFLKQSQGFIQHMIQRLQAQYDEVHSMM